MRVLLAALAVFALGCTEWPAPRILRVSPATMIATEATPIEIEVRAALLTIADYEQGTISARTRIELQIGPQVVGPDALAPGGLIQAVVPTLLPPGAHDVRVKFLDDGRTAVAPEAFTVLPGTWPQRYRIDPVGPQRRQSPFQIVVRAEGPFAQSFRGNVRLRVGPHGGIGPSISGAFVDGVLTERVIVDSVGATEAVTVTDLAGSSGTSNVFTLR